MKTEAAQNIPAYLHLADPLPRKRLDDPEVNSAPQAREGRAMNTTPPRKRGRPRKYLRKGNIRLSDIINPDAWPIIFQESKPRGRPRQTYYGLTVEQIANFADSVMADISSQIPRRQLLERILRSLQKKVGGYHDPRAVERALRRYRADKNPKKSK